MAEMGRAVTVIQDKFWITYDAANNKTGTLQPDADSGGMLHYLVDGSKCSYDSTEISNLFDFEEKPAESSWHQHHVFGYPVIKVETFNIQEKNNLPCFTKTVGSSIFFAAGYYGINFENGGWMESFCPKLGTLNKYEHIGPFKSESDMQIAIQRKKRD